MRRGCAVARPMRTMRTSSGGVGTRKPRPLGLVALMFFFRFFTLFDSSLLRFFLLPLLWFLAHAPPIRPTHPTSTSVSPPYIILMPSPIRIPGSCPVLSPSRRCSPVVSTFLYHDPLLTYLFHSPPVYSLAPHLRTHVRLLTPFVPCHLRRPGLRS